MDPHILNVYEALDMPLVDVLSLIDDACAGRLEDVTEKLDGQSFPFRVDGAGIIRFLGKGLPRRLEALGGLDRPGLVAHYMAMPDVLETFLGAYDAVQGLASVDGSLARASASRGHILAEAISPSSPNVVRYRQSVLCLLTPVGLRGPFDPGTGWTVMDVPHLQLRNGATSFEPDEDFRTTLLGIASEYDVPVPSTMGDLLVGMVERSLGCMGSLCAPDLILRMAKRLVHDDTRYINHREFPSRVAWERFRAIDDRRPWYVGDAIAPVEKLFQRLGAHVLDMYEFQLADVSDVSRVSELKGLVEQARRPDGVRGPDFLRKKLASCLGRLDIDSYRLNVEGIVFRSGARTLKLTGAFAAMNRLHSLFSFGDSRLELT